MSNYTLVDFMRCPKNGCQAQSPVRIDHNDIDGTALLNFHCGQCSYKSLGDSFHRWVQCPECSRAEDGREEKIDASVSNDGELCFRCTECNASVTQPSLNRLAKSEQKHVSQQPR